MKELSKPTSVYWFEKSPTDPEAFLLLGRDGPEIPNLLGLYENGPHAGRKYLILAEADGGKRRAFFTKNARAVGGRPYVESRRVTDFNLSAKHPNRGWGDTRCLGGNAAVLIESVPDESRIIFYIFEGLADRAHFLLQSWEGLNLPYIWADTGSKRTRLHQAIANGAYDSFVPPAIEKALAGMFNGKVTVCVKAGKIDRVIREVL